MICCFIQEKCFRQNIGMVLSLHFMEVGTGRHFRRPAILLYLFLSMEGNHPVIMKFLPTDLRDQRKSRSQPGEVSSMWIGTGARWCIVYFGFSEREEYGRSFINNEFTVIYKYIPPFITNLTFRRFLISVEGSPSTAIISANKFFLILPNFSP